MRRIRRNNTISKKLTLIISGLIFIGGLVWQACADEAQIKAKLEAIRKAGEPTTGEELQKWYPEPPAGENAATILTSAFAKLHLEGMAESLTLPVIGKAKLPEQGAPLSAAMKGSIASVLANNKEALELLHEGAKVKECRYPIDFKKGWDMPLPHLGKIKSSAQLLELEAVLAADEGKTSKAVQGTEDILHLGASLKNEPVLISQLVRVACDQIGCTTLEWVLNRRPLSDEQLHKLGVAFNEAKNPQAMTRAYIAERVSVIALFQKPPPERKALLEKAAKEVTGTPLDVTGEDWDGDWVCYLETIDRIIADSREISSKSAEAADAESKRAMLASNRKYFCTTVLIPGVTGGISRNVRGIANIRCAEVAIGTERYRRAHEFHLPASLAELTPTYLEQIPADPYGDGPLLFEKQPTSGYKIASRGSEAKKPIVIGVK